MEQKTISSSTTSGSTCKGTGGSHVHSHAYSHSHMKITKKPVSFNFYFVIAVTFCFDIYPTPTNAISAQIIATNTNGSESFSSEQADFGPAFQVLGYSGLLVTAKPLNACSEIENAPAKFASDYDYFALIEQGECDFEDKVLNAQDAGFGAVIIYNHLNNEIIHMKGNGKGDVNIPSTFVGRADGLDLKMNYTFNFKSFNAKVVIKGEFLIPLKCYLIPFVVIVGVCFAIMLLFVLFKLVRDHRAKLRNRLSRRGLKKLPTKKWKKGDMECADWESCAICLEDYEDGHKLRLLPCKHAFHCKCIDPWLTETRRVCPLCKQRITPRGELEEPSPPPSPNPENNNDDDDEDYDEDELGHEDGSRNEHDREISTSANNSRQHANYATSTSSGRLQVLYEGFRTQRNDRRNRGDSHESRETMSSQVSTEDEDVSAGYLNETDDCPLLDFRGRTPSAAANSDPENNDNTSTGSSRFSRLFRGIVGRGSRNSARVQSVSADVQTDNDATLDQVAPVSPRRQVSSTSSCAHSGCYGTNADTCLILETAYSGSGEPGTGTGVTNEGFRDRDEDDSLSSSNVSDLSGDSSSSHSSVSATVTISQRSPNNLDRSGQIGVEVGGERRDVIVEDQSQPIQTHHVTQTPSSNSSSVSSSSYHGDYSNNRDDDVTDVKMLQNV